MPPRQRTLTPTSLGDDDDEPRQQPVVPTAPPIMPSASLSSGRTSLTTAETTEEDSSLSDESNMCDAYNDATSSHATLAKPSSTTTLRRRGAKSSNDLSRRTEKTTFSKISPDSRSLDSSCNSSKRDDSEIARENHDFFNLVALVRLLA